ncbi:hypothetical protein NUW58_g4659 [Xylaria curta]|uniref:Uncharacterized protein n=1 Tax=Xylaria curta TaxID=42375 RepID=A0ACC1P5J8_9PEZI|nr:hypothetical protein NUW58_g4659 [Xylaria curta]
MSMRAAQGWPGSCSVSVPADASSTRSGYPDGPAPGNAVRPAGPNGEHTCDSPTSLERSIYEAIQTLVPDAAFGIFTGDIVDHAAWNTTVIHNALDVTHAYDGMAAAGMLVCSTAGNHEASPANSYPPLGVGSSVQWLYDALSSSWIRWVGSRATDTTRELGAYSASRNFANKVTLQPFDKKSESIQLSRVPKSMGAAFTMRALGGEINH